MKSDVEIIKSSKYITDWILGSIFGVGVFSFFTKRSKVFLLTDSKISLKTEITTTKSVHFMKIYKKVRPKLGSKIRLNYDQGGQKMENFKL